MTTTVRQDYSGRQLSTGAAQRYNLEYGSINPAKARRSWGDILKLGTKGKKESPTPSVGGSGSPHYYAPSAIMPQLQTQQQQQQQQPGANYMREYYNKYGPSGVYAQPVYMTPAGNMLGIPPANGAPSLRQDPRASSSTKGNTVKYTEWFGSVATRRPNLRPEIPSFAHPQGPQQFVQPAQDTSRLSWPAESQQQQPQPQQYVAIAMAPGVCMCPTTEVGTTRAKRKKKCKTCGQKTINIRHTLTSHPTFRPALSTAIYATPVQHQSVPVAPVTAVPARPASWDWGGSPYAVPQIAPPPIPPHPPPMSDEDSSPPTPETVRSVRSSSSTVTLTRELPEMITKESRRPVRQPLVRNVIPDKRISIVANDTTPSAYNLMKSRSEDTLSSDTDDLSDNAVNDPLSDTLSSSPERANQSTEKSVAFKRFQASRNRGRRVSIISIGEDSNADTTSNVIKISTSSPQEHVTNGHVIADTSDKSQNNRENSSSIRNGSIKITNHNSKIQITSNGDLNLPNSDGESLHNGSFENSSNYVSPTEVESNMSSDHESNQKNNSVTKKNTSTTSLSNTNESKSTHLTNGAASVNQNGVSIGHGEASKEPKKRILSRNLPVSSVRISGQKLVLMNRSASDESSDDSSDDDFPEEKNSKSASKTKNTSVDSDAYQTESGSGSTRLLFNNIDYNDDEASNNAEPDLFGLDSDTDTLADEEQETSESMNKNEALLNKLSLSSYKQNSQPLYSGSSGRMNRSVSSTSDVIYEEDEDLDRTIEDDLSNFTSVKLNEDQSNDGGTGDSNTLSVPSVQSTTEAGERSASPSSFSSTSPQRSEGFQPTLSELLQVKSILKRPNSLDTSSENDSDFFIPTSTENKNQNQLNKKKSVQFSHSDNVAVVEVSNEGRRRKLSSPKASKKDKDADAAKTNSGFSLFDDLNDVYSRKSPPEAANNMNSSNDNSSVVTMNGNSDSNSNLSLTDGDRYESSLKQSAMTNKNDYNINYNHVSHEGTDYDPMRITSSGNNSKSNSSVSATSQIKLRSNKKTSDPKHRHSSSGIPVADMSVRSGYSSPGDLVGSDNSQQTLTKPRSIENLRAEDSLHRNYDLYSEEKPQAYKKKVTRPRDFIPNAINSKYDSNWKAMFENANMDRYLSQVQGRGSNATCKEARPSKLPSPVRTENRQLSAYENNAWPHDAYKGVPKSYLHRGLNPEIAGSSEDILGADPSPALLNGGGSSPTRNWSTHSSQLLKKHSEDDNLGGRSPRNITKGARNLNLYQEHKMDNGLSGAGAGCGLGSHSNSDSKLNLKMSLNNQLGSKISNMAKSAVNLSSIPPRRNDARRDSPRKSSSPNVQKNNAINKQHLNKPDVGAVNDRRDSNELFNGVNSPNVPQQLNNGIMANQSYQSSQSNQHPSSGNRQNSNSKVGPAGDGKPPLRPTRKAPAVPPGKSPSRPTVPPPPPPAPPSQPPPPPPSEPPPPPPTEPPPPPPLPPSSMGLMGLHNRPANFDEASYRQEVEDYPDYSSSPPSSPPPPLPTSPPPPLDDYRQMLFPVDPHSQQEATNSSPRSSNSSTASYPFSSFRGDITIPTIPITPSPPHKPLKGSSPDTSTNSSPRHEILYSDTKSLFPQTMPIFSTIDEEAKTATIRGRVKPSRPALTLDLNSVHSANMNNTSTPTSRAASRQPNPSLSSFDPLRRPRSMSPDDPYEHIYEELGSIPPSPTQRHPKLNRLCKPSHHTSQPSLLRDCSLSPVNNGNALRNSQSIQPTCNNSYSKQEKLRHAQTLPPGLGKSIFDGATKLEILEILKNAKGRLSSAADEDEDVSPLTIDFSPLDSTVPNGGVAGGEGVEEGGGEDEDSFTLRHHATRASNISSNSDSSESSGLIRTDKERLISADIERTDSGVGSETSKAPKVPQHRPLTRVTTLVSGPGTGGAGGLLLSPPSSGAGSGGVVAGGKDPDVPLCEDCEAPVEARVTTSGVVYAPLVCRRCARRRQERREVLTEIIETELKYGRDLQIIVDQFYRPIQIAGLLTNSQLDSIFLNVSQLLAESQQFSDLLQDAYDIAVESGDEDLLTVNVAKLFLQATTMMDAFEYYCIRQGEASLLLQTLEKEKELMRIFLRVSQMENTLLRRMNLHSFLMVPVQRVTKYPLLLSRLHKSTPPSQPSRRDCRAAKEELERRLHHMNNETKEASPSKLWRRFSMSVAANTPLRGQRTPNPPPHSDDSSKLHKLVLESLEWAEGAVVREGRLLLLPPDTNNWTRRGRSNKMVPVYLLLVTQGQPQQTVEDSQYEDRLVTPRQLGIREAALVAFKYPARPSKQSLYKEPWLLSRCVVSWEAEGDAECFEVMDLVTKDTYYFKDRDSHSTEDWFRLIQFHAVSVGAWKRRRPALHNLMHIDSMAGR